MRVKVNQQNNITILTILDDMILDTLAEFQQTIDSLIADGHFSIMLDFYHLEFISSRGLGAIGKLVDVLRKKGGDLKIFGMKKEVKHLFDICGLSRIIDVFQTQDDALLSWGDNVGAIEKRLLWSIKQSGSNS